MLFLNRTPSYNTKANDGLYLAVSSLLCDCCGELITASAPVIVLNGQVQETSVQRVLKELTALHPSHCVLEGVTWEGDGSFLFRFAETQSSKGH